MTAPDYLSRRIRVAHVITGLELGGGGQVVTTIARALDHSRFDMDVYCIYEGGDMQADLEQLGYRVVLVKGAWDWRRRFMPYSLRGTLRLARLLRAGDYDIVHTHIFQADAIGRVAALLAGIPVRVKSLHNMGLWKRRGHIFADRLLGRWTDAVICCSAYQRELATQQERLRDGEGVLIHNGVNLARFGMTADPALASTLGLDPVRPIVGTVGRLIEAKGHEYLIAAIPQVLAYRPDAQFLFVGDGSLRAMLWERLPESARSNVFFVGARPNIPELMALMRIFAFPSVNEGFPIAPLEAMASRLPVVASDIPPLRDIVVHEQTGLLVPARNAATLARSIVALLNDPSRAAALGACGRQRVEAQFTDAHMVRATEHLYRRLLARRVGIASQAQTHETGDVKS